jgi:predicted ATPase/DNA-binding SARP family transcriptional activator
MGKGVNLSPRLALHLLGPPRLELDNSPVSIDRRKTLALLAYLAVNRGSHTRDYLSALLFPDYDQSKAFTNLRHTLWETQQAIGEGWIVADHETIGLIAGDAEHSSHPAGAGRVIWLDVAQFESLITQSRAQRDVSLRIPLLTDAVKLYRNHFLTGFSLKDALTFNEWAMGESDNLRHQLAHALTMLAEDHCSLGQAETAIPYARRLTALDPLNETSHRLLMQVYIQAGQHNAALKQYQACEKILRKELGVDPQPETRLLYKQIRKGETKPTQPVKQKELGAPGHNLPFQISTFIGRENELDDIANLIANNRLVTLVGTGGIGKTRLSLKVGEQLIKDYANGVWLMELASLSDPALVPQTVAKLFQLAEQAGESLTEKLIRVLRPKNMLLILDNCEHLLDACAQIANTLLKNCPNLKILTTSREPLGITGEAQYHVPSLGLPDLQQILERLLDYESVQLFDERARLVRENFSLTMENAASVTQICHRLDGIPLALELAAARVDMFSPEQIASRLDERFNLLTGGSRTALPRQQTLRASIDWSWDLLSEAEQVLMQRLSVFTDGWTLEAAEAVCAGNGIERQQVLDLMNDLVAKSLVIVEEQIQQPRYRLLETTRQYAQEKLLDANAGELFRDHHLDFFLTFATATESKLHGPEQVYWLDQLETENNNLRAALSWAIEHNIELGLLLANALGWFWYVRGYLSEGIEVLDILLSHSTARTRSQARALWVRSILAITKTDAESAYHSAIASLNLSQELGDPRDIAYALSMCGLSAFYSGQDVRLAIGWLDQAVDLYNSFGEDREWMLAGAMFFLGDFYSQGAGDYTRAASLYEKSLATFRKLGDTWGMAHTLLSMGNMDLRQGDYARAAQIDEEALALFREIRDKSGVAYTLGDLVSAASLRGDYQEAQAFAEEGLELDRDMGGALQIAWSLRRLGRILIQRNELGRASSLLRESLAILKQQGDSTEITTCVLRIADLALAQGRLERAARLYGACQNLSELHQAELDSHDREELERNLAVLRNMLDEAQFAPTWTQDRALTLDEAVAYALYEG